MGFKTLLKLSNFQGPSIQVPVGFAYPMSGRSEPPRAAGSVLLTEPLINVKRVRNPIRAGTGRAAARRWEQHRPVD